MFGLHRLHPATRGMAALGMAVLAVAAADHLFGIRILARLQPNSLALWGGAIGAVISAGWLAGLVAAYRLVDGPAAVDDWLDDERHVTGAIDGAKGLSTVWLWLTAEELLLRGLLLPVAGVPAAVLAAGAWRWRQGRRQVIWGLVQSLLLTAIVMLSGSLIAAWLAHGLLATLWHAYLALAPWQRAEAAVDTGATG